RDQWNPPFQAIMASLQITRDDELIMRQVANDVLARLRETLPDQEFEFADNKIKGKDRVVYLSNVYREVRGAPNSRDEIIRNFVEKVSQPPATEFGTETWEDAQTRIVPVLKPKNYIDPN